MQQKNVPLEILNEPKAKPQTAVFKGVEATWNPEEEAWLYKVPGSTLTLFWDEQRQEFFPLAAKSSYLARERVSVFGPDGTQLYRERIYLREPSGITEADLEKQRLLIQAKRNEFALRTWDWFARLAWTIPAMFVLMVGSFFWAVFKALSVYSAMAAARLGAALGELAYYGTWALGLAAAGLVAFAIFPHLFRAAFAFARTSIVHDEPESGAGVKQGVNVVINQGAGGGNMGQSGYAQGYVNR